ncbi:LmeA family phospholipid-binding protein [Streptomyces sp. NPDC054961]
MKLRRTPVLVTAGIATALAVALCTTDVVVAHSAQDRIARAAGCRLQADGPVSAELTGTFAGLRALTGEVGSLHLAAQGVRRADTEMSVEADLHDVTRDGAVGGGRATATIPYGSLQKHLADSAPAGDADAAADMKVGGDAKGLTLTGTVGRLGLPVTVRASTSTTANSLTITPTTVTVLGRELPIASLSGLPGAADLAERLAPRTVDVGDLPDGVRLTGSRPTSAGLSLDVSVAPSSSAADAEGKRCASA